MRAARCSRPARRLPMPDTSPGGTPLNVPGPGGIFDEAAHEAATEALYLRLDATKAEGRIVAKTTDEVARGVLNAALDALPERTQAFLTLAGLPEGELVERIGEAFAEREISCMRAIAETLRPLAEKEKAEAAARTPELPL